MSGEWLKYVTPILGVLIGAWLAPYIESRKSKSESKHIINCFYTELEDLLKDLPQYTLKYFNVYKKVWNVELNRIKDPSDFFPVSLPSKIEFLTIGSLTEKSFLELTRDQRKAVRALKLISQGINERLAIISEKKEMNDFVANKAALQTNTESFAIFYYLINRLCNEKERFIYTEETTEDACKKALDALNISFEFEWLVKNA
ncbi:hypothetical protein [Psychromonas aquimarina]|uniref:hypothetical protein n=1 Tax=Psychromonas aquimarina TaxID=444919 RepID=UPI0004183F1D|nr:hypothetical protein [Psychromonas aquimarina]